MSTFSKFFLFLFLCIPIVSWEQCILDQTKSLSKPQFFFNYCEDFDQNLDVHFINQIEKDLEQFALESSNQIVVLTVCDKNNCGFTDNQLATEFGDHLGIGEKKQDNGIVLLIRKSPLKGKNGVYIAVGKGLEGAIPDIKAKAIVDRIIIPEFKNLRFQSGITQGLAAIKGMAKGEYDMPLDPEQDIMPLLIFIGIILLFLYLSHKSRGRYGGRTISRRGVFDHRDSFPYGGTWGGGSFGGGGFGGGGFGGFGGGSFGGGGAGGSW